MGTRLNQFYMDRTAARYIFKNGKIAEFIGGVYRTTVESEIKELNDEIKGGIGAIWVIPGQEIVDSEDIDPIAVMKRKIIAEYEAGKAHSSNTGISFSDTSIAKASGSDKAGGSAAVSNSVGSAKAIPVGSIKLNK